MKKRLFAALLCLCLLAGLVPNMGLTAQAAGAAIGQTVEFAGHEWYIIGTPTEGVTAPEGCYTLFAKNNEFGSTTFRASADQYESGANIYQDSDLQKKMAEIANGFSAEDKANIVPRDTFDYIEGDPPADQLLWPISASGRGTGGVTNYYVGEVTAIDSSLLKFETSYWTRSNWTKSNGFTGDEYKTYYHAITVSSDGGVVIHNLGESGATASQVTETHAIRPALYVKQEAVTFVGTFQVGADTIASTSVGGDLVANTGTDTPLLTDSGQSVNVRANESGGRIQSGTSLTFRLYASGTTTGADQVLACVLTGSTGAVQYYGKLADCSGTLTNSFNISVPMTGVKDGTYTLSIFAHNTADNTISAPYPTMTVEVSDGTGTVSNYNGGTYVDGGSLRFTQQPQDQDVQTNETATFSVEAVDGTGSDESVTYTWQVQPIDYPYYWNTIQDASTGEDYHDTSITFTDLTGTWADNGFSLGISGEDDVIKISDGFRIRCRATSPNSFYTVDSNSVMLTVDPAPAFTRHPQDQTAEAGSATSFSAEAASIGGVTYTWQAQPKTNNPENLWYDIYTWPKGDVVVNTLYRGQTLDLPNASGSWRDNEIVLNDGSGFVYASSFDPAEARFRCVATDESGRVAYSDPAKLTVTGSTPTITGVTVTPATATVQPGSTRQFSASVTGTGAYDQTVTWSVSGNQNSGTTIDQDGLLTVAADETATTLTVTATASDGTTSGTASVTVRSGTDPGPVTVIAGYGGTIDQTTYTATASSGFVIDQMWVDGAEIAAASGQTSYTPTATPSSSVFVTFAYTVNFPDPAGGSLSVTRGGVTLTSGTIVRPGDVLTITASPDSGYTLESLTVNGTSVTAANGGVTTYTVGAQPTATRTVGGAAVAAVGANITAVFTESGATPPAITGVTVTPATATVQPGGTRQFSATVTGTGNFSQAVTWTVEGAVSNGTTISASGLLTVGTDETAAALTVRATASGDSTKSGTAAVTVEMAPAPQEFTISFDGNGGSSPAAQTTVDGRLTSLPASTRSGYDFLGWYTAASGGTRVTTGTVFAADATLYAHWDRRSSGGSSGGGSEPAQPTVPSTEESDGWTNIQEELGGAEDGDTITVDMNGATEVPGQVLEEVAGKDTSVELDMGGGVSWTINGQDVPEGVSLSDLDLGVSMDTSGISADVINTVSGEYGAVQVSLDHDGEFGFALTLTAPLGRENAGHWANLYHYDETSEALTFVSSTRIAGDGSAALRMTHASQYAIVIDEKSHALPFEDVPTGHWAYDAILYAYDNGLMAGTSGTTFAPEGVTTRGQIVTILWRMAGSPQVNYLMDYSDVDPAAYYAEAIRWATSEGIAGGYGGGVFGPDDPITREQLAVMLHRCAQHEGCDVSVGEDTNILSYADAFEVSEYAVAALQWACGAGIIHGTGDGSTLTPQGGATRAQAAVMLMRFCESYK